MRKGREDEERDIGKEEQKKIRSEEEEMGRGRGDRTEE